MAFDGWTESSVHYLGVFAVYPDNQLESGYNKVLLSFAPLIHDEDLSAASHHESIYEILQTFGKNFSNVACIIGDNCSVNQSLAKKCRCYLVGCASHRLNLAVQKYLGGFSYCLDSVRKFMVFLRTVKARAALRKKTLLSPILDNATRWSSKFEMLKRYTQLKAHVEEIVPLDIQLIHEDNLEIDSILVTLGQLEILTKYLQSEDRHIFEVQTAFSSSLEIFPFLKDYCSPTSDIVCDPYFESAVGKIQQNQFHGEPLQLTPREAQCVHHLKVADSGQESGVSTTSEPADAMTLILQNVKKAKVQKSPYVDLRFIRPTSNICERFFSLSKLALPDNRKRLLPANLEIQLFLKVNRHLWDMELFHSIQE